MGATGPLHGRGSPPRLKPLARMRASTASGILIPSHRMNWIVLGRPHGAKVRMILRHLTPWLWHSAA